MKEAGVGMGTGSRSRQVVTSCPMSSLMTMFPILSSSSARECREALAVARFSMQRHRNQPATSCTQHSLWRAKKLVPCWTPSCVQHSYTFLCTTRLHIPVYSIVKHSCVQHKYTFLCTITHLCVQHNDTFLCTAQLHICVQHNDTFLCTAHLCVQHNYPYLYTTQLPFFWCTAQLSISVHNTVTRFYVQRNYKWLCTPQLIT